VSPRTIRRLVLAVFVAGIAGMIIGSIVDNNGVAITFGLVTAVAAVGLILVSAVAPPDAFGSRRGDASPATTGTPDAEAEQAGALIEEQVARLMAGGADEADLRELVRRSISFGRQATRP